MRVCVHFTYNQVARGWCPSKGGVEEEGCTESGVLARRACLTLTWRLQGRGECDECDKTEVVLMMVMVVMVMMVMVVDDDVDGGDGGDD